MTAQWVNHCHLSRRMSSTVCKQHPLLPWDELREFVQTQSGFGAEAEQQPIQRDDEGIPRRRDRNLLEMDKEVPTLRTKRPSFALTMDTCRCRPWFGRSKDAGVRPSIRRWE